MLYYNKQNKLHSRSLRKHLTEAEKFLWHRLRKKQILNVRFYRQKPILNYIVDFYAPAVQLVIELDGGQHSEPFLERRDQIRSEDLSQLNLKVFRFSNFDVLQRIDDVILTIFNHIADHKKIYL